MGLARTRSSLRRLGLALTLGLLLAPATGARAEEAGEGIRCAYPAVVDDDAGAQAIYEGLRLGLEHAHLPRICLEAVSADDAGWARFVGTWRAEHARRAGEHDPQVLVVAIGDEPTRRLRTSLPMCKRVGVVRRYAAKGTALRPVPAADAGFGVVVGRVDAERVGSTLRELTGSKRPRVAWAGTANAELRARFVAAAGLELASTKPEVLLDLDLGGTRAALEATGAQARRLGVPWVSDDRGRWGQGPLLVLVPDHELVGRLAADVARQLVRGASRKAVARRWSGMHVWVDLRAADAQRVQVPLGLLAEAERLRRGRRR